MGNARGPGPDPVLAAASFALEATRAQCMEESMVGGFPIDPVIPVNDFVPRPLPAAATFRPIPHGEATPPAAVSARIQSFTLAAGDESASPPTLLTWRAGSLADADTVFGDDVTGEGSAGGERA